MGDSLSPYLFIIYEEDLSSLIDTLSRFRYFHGVRIITSIQTISYLFSIDDNVLFFKVKLNEVQEITYLLMEYTPGKVINFNKSLIYFSPSTVK